MNLAPKPPSTKRVTWTKTHRIVRSVYPPIDLFEDIADPSDWDALARAECATNPRIMETIGRLEDIPPERRVSGPGASWVMAPFTHASTDRPSRFSDGHHGVYYAGDSVEVALFETIHHHSLFMRATAETPGWTSHFRQLIGSIDATLLDLRKPGWSNCLEPDGINVAQSLARDLHKAGSDGIVYPSVRLPEGQCIAVFWPDVVSVPIQGRRFSYHWSGEQVDLVRDDTSGETFRIKD